MEGLVADSHGARVDYNRALTGAATLRFIDLGIVST